MFHELTMGWRADSERHGDWLAVTLHPPSDSFVEAPRLADDLWGVVTSQGGNLIILDLRYLTLLPSSLMGVLVRLNKRVTMTGGAVHLCCLTSHCVEALKICHLDRVLPVYADREAATRGGIEEVPTLA